MLIGTRNFNGKGSLISGQSNQHRRSQPRFNHLIFPSTIKQQRAVRRAGCPVESRHKRLAAGNSLTNRCIASRGALVYYRETCYTHCSWLFFMSFHKRRIMPVKSTLSIKTSRAYHLVHYGRSGMKGARYDLYSLALPGAGFMRDAFVLIQTIERLCSQLSRVAIESISLPFPFVSRREHRSRC